MESGGRLEIVKSPTAQLAAIERGVGALSVRRKLYRIATSQHVIVKYHASQTGQAYAASLKRTSPAIHEMFGPLLNLLVSDGLPRIHEAAVLPVPMWAQHARQLLRLARLRSDGSVQIAGHEMPRKGLEKHFLDRVVTLVDSPMNDRLERGLFRHGP